jgi:ribosomal protein S18 acetylase RimI-like enzyme
VVYRSAKRKIDYDLDIRALTAADLGQAHQLSIEVGWPHRPEDWRLVFSLGHGFIACDAIGRALGSAMWWPLGENLASVGMVITSPRLQAQGSGRRLMDLIFAETGARDLRLNSTRAGYRLYRSLGFEPIGRIFQHQGRPLALEASEDINGLTLRAATTADLPALALLDRQACGADRTPVIQALLAVSVGIVAERDGQPVGFSLCRPFGRGHVVGPIVAEDDAVAIALTRPHVVAHEGTFLRIDTAQEHGAFGTFLEACGLTMYDTVTPMIRGAAHAGTGPVRTFGLVNQALG